MAFVMLTSVAQYKAFYQLKADLPQIAKKLLETARTEGCETLYLDPVSLEDLPDIPPIERFRRNHPDSLLHFLRSKPGPPYSLDHIYIFSIFQAGVESKLLSDAYKILAPIEGLRDFEEGYKEFQDFEVSEEVWEEHRAGFAAFNKLKKEARKERRKTGNSRNVDFMDLIDDMFYDDDDDEDEDDDG